MKNLKEISSKNNPQTGNKIIDSFNLAYCRSNTTLLLDNIKDKKVLVLGSGPSATEIDWVNGDWDVLVTTSYFYLVPEILEQKPVHVSLSNQIDLKDERLINYLDDNPHCTIGIENPKFFSGEGRFKRVNAHKFDDSLLLLTEFHSKYKDRIIYYQVFIDDEAEMVGVASRVCYPVLMANPKSLSICGIDGYSKTPEKDPPNYFRYRNDKNVPPIIYSWLAGDAEPLLKRRLLKGEPIKDFMVNGAYQKTIGKLKDNYNKFKTDFEEFGERLYTVGNHHNIPIYNWGKGKPYNMVSSISEKYEKS
tara:strand:+ start:359 stop:1273 length:915 start_codon:yes stop_codon:yes gene_type:complete